MRILYWNLNKNNNEKWIKDLICDNSVDIALFSEYGNTSLDNVVDSLEGNYLYHDGFGACDKVTLLCKKDIKTTIKREQNRYTLYVCHINGSIYNLAGIHLPASPSSSPEDRKEVIRDIVKDIDELEKEQNNRNTIVIGDFNCNPFDDEVIQKDTFNAVLFKSLIEKHESVIYHNKIRRRFYNPILDYISEETKTYGSIYYSSGINALYWNSFDQILVRKDIANEIKLLEYVKTIRGKTLIKDVVPDKAISDHLPLLVDLEKGDQ